MSASSSSQDPNATGEGGNTPSGGSHGSDKKSNVCLICGIYTNLSLNIFEPRSGPNIREVIYQKYNFKAERGNNEDKFICYSCNNWLINWYSLQYLSETRNYESTSASNRSQAEYRNSQSKSGRSNSIAMSRYDQCKENLEQDNRVSSTVTIPKIAKSLTNAKQKRPLCRVFKELMQTNSISCSNSNIQAKSSECHLIQMLNKQGTSVTKENLSPVSLPTSTKQFGKSNIGSKKISIEGQISNTNDIVLSFNSTISEIVDDVPSLRLLCHNDSNHQKSLRKKETESLMKRTTSQSLSISLINPVSGSSLS